VAQYLGSVDPNAFRNGGSCSRCNRGDRLVDIDVLIDYEGNVAVCVGCAAEVAVAAGLLSPKEASARVARQSKGA
jgi:hypothetical protein